MKTIKLMNIAKSQLQHVDTKCPVVSISDVYSSPAAIPGSKVKPIPRDVVYADFFALDHFPEDTDESKGLNKETVKNIIDLIKRTANTDHDKIYFQCGEGRIRSYTLASELAFLQTYSDDGIRGLENINLKYSSEESDIKKGITDVRTARLLIKHVEELNKEHLESKENE